jgi:threonine/homoserine/homoserine lactone efflux protein
MEIYSVTLLATIFAFSFATSITPGPNNIMLLSSGLTFGYKKTVPHLLGVIIGFPLMTLLVGLGLGKIFETYPIILTILKVVGTIYLLWLAWKIANSTPSLNEDETSKQPLKFIPIVLFQWVNPKNWIKIITAMSVYVNSAEHALSQIIIITIIFLSTVVVSANSWTLGGVALKRFIKNKKAIRAFNISMALLLILSIIFSFWNT